MTYNNFIGIDIGKFNFVVAVHDNKTTQEYANNPEGIHTFIKEYKKNLKDSLCVLETTGGYEMELLLTLCDKGFAVHRANTRNVKNFIRSFGNAAKTDALDAKALALYGFERGNRLELFVPQTKRALYLYKLIGRRQDLKKMLVAEKNRSKSPNSKLDNKLENLMKESFGTMIVLIEKQIQTINEAINKLIADDLVLKEKKEILKSIPGIGDITANELLAVIPELGSLNQKQVASLAGVAPRANDSGTVKGYRSTAPGRNIVKPILFMAAMAARNSNSKLKAFYENLIKNGKKKMVALTALMRKIIVIANACLKNLQHMNQHG